MDKENGSVKGGILMEAITSVRDASEHEAGKKEHVFAIVTPARSTGSFSPLSPVFVVVAVPAETPTTRPHLTSCSVAPLPAAFIQHADSAAEKESWVTKVKQQVAALEGTATATIPGNANGLPNSDDKLPQVKPF